MITVIVVAAGSTGLVAGLLIALGIHERREFRRYDQREALQNAQHETVVRELRDALAFARAAVNDRRQFEARLAALEGAVNAHADSIDLLIPGQRSERI